MFNPQAFIQPSTYIYSKKKKHITCTIKKKILYPSNIDIKRIDRVV